MKTRNRMMAGIFGIAALICLEFSCARKEEPAPAPVVRSADEQAVIDDAQDEASRQEYKHDQERRIKENEDRMEELRTKINNADERMRAEYRQRMDDLKDRNEKLRTRMNEYRHENKSKWEEFKREWNRDMDELGEALRNFSVDNKK